MAVGKFESKFYTVVYTYRGLKVRIISTRRSRKDEEKLYTAKEFDEMFDRGDDISEFLDFENIKSFKELHKDRVENIVKIEEDLLRYFPDEKSVNDALRGLAKILDERFKKSA